MSVRKASVFYFDKKNTQKKKYYLGADIFTAAENGLQYDQIACAVIKRLLPEIIYAENMCRDIFKEDAIAGTVICFKWGSGDESQTVTIWVEKNDMQKFCISQITFSELVTRSTITDTAGKILKITL